MKTLIIAVGFSFAATVIIQAQSARLKIKVKEAEIPVPVVTSFKKDFKGAEAEEWSIVPAAVVGEEYTVSGYDDLNGVKPTSYAVKIKGVSIKGEAIYDQNGELKYAKEIIKDIALPVVVRDAVSKKYPGYALLKDQEIIKGGKKNFVHYRVIIISGEEKVALAIDDSGKILNEKKVKPMRL